MNGHVDHSGRALIELSVRSSDAVVPTCVVAWVDTAFTGELVFPHSMIEKLKLKQSATVTAGLADGSQVVLGTYSCIIEWHGRRQVVEVVENDGQIPLLGVGLLHNTKLEIDYRKHTLVIS